MLSTHRGRSIFLACAVLFTGITISTILISTAEQPELRAEVENVPLVIVQKFIPRTIHIPIETRGVITAKSRITLASQVGGRIIEISDELAEGGQFNKGDLLLRVDPRNYQVQVVHAKATLATARQDFAQEQQRAKLARQDWKNYGGSQPSQLVLRAPQLRNSQAQVNSALAQVKQTELDLERTNVRAPFDGYVEKRAVNVGQIAMANSELAIIFASDIAQVQLPVTERDLERLGDISATHASGDDSQDRLSVAFFRASRREGTTSFNGEVVRIERILDPQTKLYNLIAEISDPFSSSTGRGLMVGEFVEAEIETPKIRDVVELPLTALIDDGKVLIATPSAQLVYRSVRVVRRRADKADVVIERFSENDQVVLIPPPLHFPGMKVTLSQPASSDMAAQEVPMTSQGGADNE